MKDKAITYNFAAHKKIDMKQFFKFMLASMAGFFVAGFLMILSSIKYIFFDTAVSAVLIEYHFLFSTQTFGILL